MDEHTRSIFCLITLVRVWRFLTMTRSTRPSCESRLAAINHLTLHGNSTLCTRGNGQRLDAISSYTRTREKRISYSRYSLYHHRPRLFGQGVVAMPWETRRAFFSLSRENLLQVDRAVLTNFTGNRALFRSFFCDKNAHYICDMNDLEH